MTFFQFHILLPVHLGARGQHEEEEEAEKCEKEGEGQAAEAREEEVEGGISSTHRAALPYPATGTGLTTRLVRPDYPAAGWMRIRCERQ